ncbi:NDMA-dependent alcohol dehydrogenase [Mycolicibacterium wolinskyi]|uniref:alcohol dehydrogenase n=1 Tax=Mycolicibacterium wolinskyi TaxID=59750 RepID=A0A1X2FI22_9MYCO|nr:MULTISPECIES: NDMA-dependent alcohol dehydrogenase [Mycolicibacterium]MCV7290113.1 NDMA-dependent alcohol dehydrogenase [Mycolicibacterium wolinskyi]MCV7292824.1 NDMA-dependent alcohol dehydrogenase [Mycolicibacterium goodii]ORX18095.1 alcohol dehydrogenase [Mycolicibacterium wolinskyi]
MEMNAPVLWDVNGDWSIEEVELDPPRDGEVLVSFHATGLCHSDHHARTGDLAGPLPLIGGHEGAGVVEEVGPGVRDLRPGDHVVASFLPACGRCRWCARGRQNLCDLGAFINTGTQLDGTYRRHIGDQDINVMLLLGTFAPYGVVSEASLVKIDDDLPLSRACLIGCGITTGWGSAVNTANVQPGDTVVVIGCGGVGSGAIQGARLAGAEKIVAVDIAAGKRYKAFEFGATHFATSMAEAASLVGDMTKGRMADSVILAVGLVESHMVGEALDIVGKGGAVVLTALAPETDVTPTMSMAALTLYQKRLLGTLYGEANPRNDIPRLLSLYRAGKLLLDEAVSTEYQIGDINAAYDDMLAGRIIRGVVIHEH